MVKRLSQLVAPWPELVPAGAGDPDVAAVEVDSRRCGPGALFVAVRGAAADGHDYLEAALAAGCAAVAVEAGRALPPGAEDVPRVVAPTTHGLPARLAREIHGRPDERLRLAGVTGTNGKTTVSFLLRAMLTRATGSCGLIGTIRYETGRRGEPAPLTTPDGTVLYRLLAEMTDAGLAAAALEISSHALVQGRVADLALDVAVLTNLGRDHLDYHRDMAEYRAAKLAILDLLRPGPERGKAPGTVVHNLADPAFAELDAGGLRRIGFDAGLRGAPAAGAEVAVVDGALGLDGTRLELRHPDGAATVESPLVGRFNQENLTAAFAAGLALGLAPDACAAALADVPQVPGRLERIALPSGAIAVVDYAHTPDAVEAVLAACRELTDGRLLLVLGCGGDRDRGKRPLMGAAAARGADRVWITSDNPRSEDPAAICEAIRAGHAAEPSPRGGPCAVVVDRREAVAAALAAAAAGDVVVVAGKGHEDYQLVGSRRLHLDDREIVRDWIAGEGADG